MKKTITLLTFILSAKIILACSCWPYEPNFYKNISKDHQICMAVFDTMRYNSVISEDQQIQTGYFVLLDTIGAFNGDIGDTLVVYGQDGLNCGEWMEFFKQGDTIMLALDKGYNNYSGKDTFTLNSICGSHFLIMNNGGFNKLSFTEAKQKINYLLDASDVRCSCSGLPPEFEFYFHVKNSAAVCMARFIDYNYAYSYEGRKVQTGYFLVLDSIKGMDAKQGDTIVVLGEDGINCGEMLEQFGKGDTMFLALQMSDYTEGRDTFYLKGGTCGYQFLKLENGMSQGSAISEIKDKIVSIINSIDKPEAEYSLNIYPNPAQDQLFIESKLSKIQSVELYNVLGQRLKTITNINDTYFEFDISNHESGILHIVVRTEDGSYTRKIIKQ